MFSNFNNFNCNNLGCERLLKHKKKYVTFNALHKLIYIYNETQLTVEGGDELANGIAVG